MYYLRIEVLRKAWRGAAQAQYKTAILSEYQCTRSNGRKFRQNYLDLHNRQ